MKEIGGYQDFERYNYPMLHDDGIKLNCGRNCLAYLIMAKKIRKIYLPHLICDSVIDTCLKYNIDVEYYHTDLNFKPENMSSTEDWVYLVNFYGQLTELDIIQFKGKCKNLIVDNAQAYYDDPIENIDTIYTCRKFFGVPDGAILYTDIELEKEFETAESYNHMQFLMGRFERTATEFYSLMIENNKRFTNEPIKHMSRLTENILHSINYDDIKHRRTENYRYLSEKLNKMNKLHLREIEGAFSYPLMIDNAERIKNELIKNKVYIPTLWPNVPKVVSDYRLVGDILPIPCDQRYGLPEMEYIVGLIIDNMIRVYK